MQKTAQNEINIIIVTQTRDKLMELLRDYLTIDKFSNLFNRIKKSSNKKSVLITLVALVFFIIALFSNFMIHNPVVSLPPSILVMSITIIIIINQWKNLQKHHDEINDRRYDDICKLLRAKSINSENIKDVIDYFTVESEPSSVVVNKSPKLNIAFKFVTDVFLLILGIMLTKYADEIISLNLMQAYRIIIFILGVYILIISIIRIFQFITKDSYTLKIRKLVRDLKKIDSLNSMEVL